MNIQEVPVVARGGGRGRRGGRGGRGGGVRRRVSDTDRQRLVHEYETDGDYRQLAIQLAVNPETALCIIRTWNKDARDVALLMGDPTNGAGHTQYCCGHAIHHFGTSSARNAA